jgi:pimeloyl-ACP methyl ester carboxylesterase
VERDPLRAAFFGRLATFSRLILFDKRGTGMSDRTSQIFTLEQRMEDVQAVMDAAGSKRAALFGLSEGGPMSFVFAASHAHAGAHHLWLVRKARLGGGFTRGPGKTTDGTPRSSTSSATGARRRALT